MPLALDSPGTGVIYRISTPPETAAEGLFDPTRDALVNALRDETLARTSFSLGRETLPGLLLRWGAIVGTGFCVGTGPALFEPTPRIQQMPVAIVGRPRFESAPDQTARTTQDPPAYAAFKDLGAWLDAQDSQISDMVGIGRTTPYSWKRASHEPRAKTAQRVYEYQATLDSLRRRLGAAGLRRWLREGAPTRRDTLLAGRLDDLDADVHAVLFQRPSEQRPDLAAAPEDLRPAPAERGRPALPSGRRPRRPPE